MSHYFKILAGIEVESLKQVLLDNVEDNFDNLWTILFDAQDRPDYIIMDNETPEELMECLRDQYKDMYEEECTDNQKLVKFILDEPLRDRRALLYPICLENINMYDGIIYKSICVDDYEIIDIYQGILKDVAGKLRIKEYKLKKWIEIW